MSWNKITVMITDPRQVIYYYDDEQTQLAFKVTYSPDSFGGKGVVNLAKHVIVGEKQLGVLLEMLIDAQQYTDGIYPNLSES